MELNDKVRFGELSDRVKIMLNTGIDLEQIHKSLSKEDSEILKKAFDEGMIQKSETNDIEKGKKATIGEIRIWNGKKVRKEASGKWVEVSESHGLSKKEHEDKAQEHRSNMEVSNKKGEGHIYHKEMSKRDEHKDIASKLSDKEYADEEVEGEKAEEKK
jgi:hypothetical protein